MDCDRLIYETEETILIRRLARNVQLLDFVGLSCKGGGVDGYLEKFSSGVQKADHVFLVALRSLVRHLERTRRIGLEETAENFAGLFFGTVAGGGDDGDVQVVGKPGGERCGISGGQVFGDGGEDGKTVFRGLLKAFCAAHEL